MIFPPDRKFYLVIGSGIGGISKDYPYYDSSTMDLICIDRNYIENKKIKTNKNKIYIYNQDILKTLSSLEVKVDFIYASRIFEHFSFVNNDLLYLLYLCHSSLNDDGKLIGIVPDYNKIFLQLHLVQSKINKSLFTHIDLIKIHTEFFNTDEDPHKSIWTPELVYYYLGLEHYFQVSNLKTNYMVDLRDWYIYFEAHKYIQGES
ncbi:MAG: hypothetical protein KatS3mg002_0255 [Candidatus Woesearchaeota archaeon]|nr:MAG: hypothetical protein KatS3mg002_0255 [Candidatus Woesearchaeota archaeon]